LQNDFPDTLERVRGSTTMLGINTASFAKAISKAFADATTGGKQFDDVLKQLALRLYNLAVAQAFNPAAKGLAGGLSKLFESLFGGGGDASGTVRGHPITPFAAGGVIGTPAYFPLSSSGIGMAGEAGPRSNRSADARIRWATGHCDEWRQPRAQCHGSDHNS
jgi:phage-related minor tail protein